MNRAAALRLPRGRQPEGRRPLLGELQPIDIALALGFGCLFLGIDLKLGGIRLSASVFFAAVSFGLSLPSLQRPARLACIIAPTLFIFLAQHLVSAFTVNLGSGLLKVAQAISVMMLVGPFVVRYTTGGIRPFYRAMAWLLIPLLIYTIGWHVSHGFVMGWKRLDETKTIFVTMPFMCMAFIAMRSEASKRFGLAVFLIGGVLVLMSGERKAFLVLAAAAPFAFSLRNPITYLAPVAFVIMIAGVSTLDSRGYLQGQLNSITAHAEGVTSDTMSDRKRDWLADQAIRMFKEHPLTGVGTNGFLQDVSAYRVAKERGAIVIVHGEFLRVAAENGVLGLIAFGLLLLVGLAEVLIPRRGGRVRSPDERMLAFVLYASMLAYITYEAFDTFTLVVICLMPYVGRLRLDPKDAPAPADQIALRRGRPGWSRGPSQAWRGAE